MHWRILSHVLNGFNTLLAPLLMRYNWSTNIHVQDYDKIPILHSVLVLDPPKAFDGDHSIAFYIPAHVDTARSVIICKFYAYLNKEQHFQTLYYHKNV
jgi:hypothetical protein